MEELSGEELATLSIMRGYKPGYRATAMAEVGLGKYSPGNPTIAALVARGYVKVASNGAMSLDREKVESALAKHAMPRGYKGVISSYAYAKCPEPQGYDWAWQYGPEHRRPDERW